MIALLRASYAAGQLTTPKSGKVRSVPLAPDVAAVLAKLGSRADQVGDDDPVFAGAADGGFAATSQQQCRRQGSNLRPSD